jgi:branched-chain amino acid transport system substrate-binding protein
MTTHSPRMKPLIAAALLLAGGLSFSGTAFAAEKTLTIGVNDALTGGGAVYGLAQANAVTMAVKEINAAGGVKVGADVYKLNVITNDDKAAPTEATNSVRKLIDRDNIKYLLGFCCSGSTSAVASFIGKEDVVMLVGNAAERAITTQGLSNLFRTRPPADYTGAAAGRFVAAKGATKLAVIGSLEVSFYNQYLEAFEKEFIKSGGKIIAKESFALKDRDMSPQLTKVRGLEPDAILVIGYVEPAAFVYRQSVELGLNVPRYGFTSGSEEQFLRVATSEQMEGVWDLRPTELTLESAGPTGVKFNANYKAAFGAAPSPSSPYAYDQVYVLKHAFEAAGTVDDPKKVATAIAKSGIPAESVMKYLAVAGAMFDENGQAYTTNGAFQWRKGAWVFAEDLPSDPAEYSKYLRTLRK